MSKAIASLRSAKSFRVVGTVVEGADRTDIDLGLTDTGSAGTVAVSGTEIQVIVIGTDRLLQGVRRGLAETSSGPAERRGHRPAPAWQVDQRLVQR